MKKLCVFYKQAWKWLGKEVQWIVCKECQKKLLAGKLLKTKFKIESGTCPHCGEYMGSFNHGVCGKCKKYCGCSFDPCSMNDYCQAHRPR
jgi:hypothetical protein